MKRLMRQVGVLILISFAAGTSAQTVIKGVVKDNKSNPLHGVSISIKDSYDGSTTDSTGKYSFKTSEKGDKILQITSIGYNPFEQSVKLDGSAVTINAIMKEEISELTAVVISAGTFEASDRKRVTAV